MPSTAIVPAQDNTPVKPLPKRLAAIPDLVIDIFGDPAQPVLCPESRQAKCFGPGWTSRAVKQLNRTTGHYKQIPMLCGGEKCYYAKLCESSQASYVFEGFLCPYEVREIFYKFVGYVRELSVGPDDYVDLQMLVDLIRIEIMLRRIDQRLQINDLLGDVLELGRHSDKPIKVGEAAHPLIEQQRKFRADRNTLYNKLIVSRDAKFKAQATQSKEERSMMGLMAMFNKAAKKRANAQAEQALEVEFQETTVSPEEPEEIEPFEDEI